MIKTLLIANRGEIACRIMRSARALGVRTVAVYSAADQKALHVRQADVAIPIGPAPVAESYLQPQKLLDAAAQSGADAIHPGYGFLSENPQFAEAVQAAGLTWVGPPAAAIRAMGLKDAAKKVMAEAGVPVTPGYLGDQQDANRLQREADKIGYPVLIKAVAGGGGKGMRKVDQRSDFAAALASCRREAAAAFGDDRVLLEKYVLNPRHIEVQVFADRHGHVVHLFERDCSLQRRHQKVIEEAPAPGMSAATREAICSAAVRAAQAVSYEGAGTVEFIADGSGPLHAERIWFMEMNTRLQVEHPVTEAVTGVDLVEWQLRVASGEPLPKAQHQLVLQGHAIEARLYAENPASGFLPSTGPLTHLRMPDAVRVDTGVEQGAAVTPYYDPMIAKLIAHAPTRRAAALDLAAACATVEVWPVKTNAGFLTRALSHEEFLEARIDTGFVDQHLPALIPKAEPTASVLQSAARARLAAFQDARTPWGDTAGFRLNADPRVQVELQSGPARYCIEVSENIESCSTVRVHEEILVFESGHCYPFSAPESQSAGGGAAADGALRAPMPGRIIAIAVQEGDSVVKGQTLVTLEAMKMEHTLTAPFDGVVADLGVQVMDQVSEGAMLLRITPQET